jgi:hypothetical protein
MDGGQNQRLPVGRNLERRFNIPLKQIENGFLDNQGHTVSVLNQVFFHLELPLSRDTVDTLYHPLEAVSTAKTSQPRTARQ